MELIKMEMTPKERLTAYAKGEEVDRIPTTLTAAETSPLMYGIKLSDHYFSASLMVETETRLAQDFGADNMGIGIGLRGLVEALGTKLAYPEDSVSYIVAPAIQNFSDVDNKELPDIEKDGRLPIIVESFQRLQERFGDERILASGLAGPLTTAASLIGTEKYLKGLIKDKAGVHKLMQYATDCVVKCCKDMNAKLGIKLSLAEPLASGSLLSVSQFREFFVPYLKQTVKRMNEFQGSTSLHICGKTSDRWQEIVDGGVSGFWMDNCESLKEMKERFGDRVGLTGNVTPVDVLKNGTPEMVEAHARQCIADAGDSPCGFTLCPGCTTPILTPKENLIAFMNAAAKYGRRARKGKMPEGMSAA